MSYENIYLALYTFANFDVFGIPLPRLLAPVIGVVLLWKSRMVSSVALKVFSVVFALIVYFLPTIVNLFAGGG